jgi:hypothetical protein
MIITTYYSIIVEEFSPCSSVPTADSNFGYRGNCSTESCRYVQLTSVMAMGEVVRAQRTNTHVMPGHMPKTLS